MYYLDSSYIIFMVPAFLVMAAANWWVNSTYKRWGQTRNSVGMNGQDAAQRLLAHARLPGVEVAAAQGCLGDHYDPRSRRLHLSPEVAGVPSVASLAITAHEIGHAMQDRDGYAPLRLRSALVPAASVGSWLGWILIFIGLVLGFFELAVVGLVVFAVGAVFALATLPVEFNASARARQLLTDAGLLYTEEERRGVSSVLNAAAFTYVAALIVAVLNVLRFAFMIGGLGRRRD
ncbi:MAG: zinc metallopeptidase [Chloroflexi bacterium]|nr:zinc metallopeptidase [Chloroflexota bacterium]